MILPIWRQQLQSSPSWSSQKGTWREAHVSFLGASSHHALSQQWLRNIPCPRSQAAKPVLPSAGRMGAHKTCVTVGRSWSPLPIAPYPAVLESSGYPEVMGLLCCKVAAGPQILSLELERSLERERKVCGNSRQEL